MRLAAGERCRQGFTLLELLLVLVIIGVIAATVATSIPNIGSARRVQAEAERLALAIELARGEALRGNEMWGLSVHERGYAFHTFDEDGRWGAVSRSPLAPWQAEEGVVMALAAASPAPDGESHSAEEPDAPATPEIAILPGGETTPFVVTIAPVADGADGVDDERAWVVQSDGFSRAAAARQADLMPRAPVTLR